MKNKIISIVGYKERLKDEIYNIESESEIPKIANNILNAYGFKNKVVDIVTLGWGLGFYVASRKLDDNIEDKALIASGDSIYRKFGRWKCICICINELYDKFDQRYILAICMSYYLLNSNNEKNEFYAIFKESSENEFDMAIKFAENLLIPDKLLQEQLKLEHNNSYFMSKYFKVPEYVVRSRIKNFNKL